MGLFSRRQPTYTKAELEEYRAAKRSLNAYRSPTRREDDEYHRRNDRVIEAEKHIPRCKR